MHNDEPAESLIFKAVADPTRRAIVDLLRVNSLPVQAITAHFSISRPAISRHLKILRQSGLVSEIRNGRQRIYALRAEVLKPALAWLSIGNVLSVNTAKQSSIEKSSKPMADSNDLKTSIERNWQAW